MRVEWDGAGIGQRDQAKDEISQPAPCNTVPSRFATVKVDTAGEQDLRNLALEP